MPRVNEREISEKSLGRPRIIGDASPSSGRRRQQHRGHVSPKDTDRQGRRPAVWLKLRGPRLRVQRLHERRCRGYVDSTESRSSDYSNGPWKAGRRSVKCNRDSNKFDRRDGRQDLGSSARYIYRGIAPTPRGTLLRILTRVLLSRRYSSSRDGAEGDEDPLSTPLRRENICIVAALAPWIHPSVIAVEIVISYVETAPPRRVNSLEQARPARFRCTAEITKDSCESRAVSRNAILFESVNERRCVTHGSLQSARSMALRETATYLRFVEPT